MVTMAPAMMVIEPMETATKSSAGTLPRSARISVLASSAGKRTIKSNVIERVPHLLAAEFDARERIAN